MIPLSAAFWGGLTGLKVAEYIMNTEGDDRQRYYPDPAPNEGSSPYYPDEEDIRRQVDERVRNEMQLQHERILYLNQIINKIIIEVLNERRVINHQTSKTRLAKILKEIHSLLEELIPLDTELLKSISPLVLRSFGNTPRAKIHKDLHETNLRKKIKALVTDLVKELNTKNA